MTALAASVVPLEKKIIAVSRGCLAETGLNCAVFSFVLLCVSSFQSFPPKTTTSVSSFTSDKLDSIISVDSLLMNIILGFTSLMRCLQSTEKYYI